MPLIPSLPLYLGYYYGGKMLLAEWTLLIAENLWHQLTIYVKVAGFVE